MSRKVMRSGALAAVVMVTAVLIWQLWPQGEPSPGNHLTDVPGVTSASDTQVRLSETASLAALKSSVAEIAELTARDDLSLMVFVGEVFFRLAPGHDGERATELAWAAAGTTDLQSGQVVTIGQMMLDIKLSEGASLVEATDQLLDRLAEESLDLPERSVKLSIPSATYEFTEVRIADLTLAEARSAQDTLTAVLQSSGADLVRADLGDPDTDLTLGTPDLSGVGRAQQSVIDAFGRDDVRLNIRAGDLIISDLVKHSPADAVDLASRVQETGAMVTDVDGGLDHITIGSPTPDVAQAVLRLMATSEWTVGPAGRVSLQIDGQSGYEASSLSGDTAAVRRMGPTFLGVHRLGYRAEVTLAPTGDELENFAVAPGLYTDGRPDPDPTSDRSGRALVDLLRSGDWAGQMELTIFASGTVFVDFHSTTDGRAEEVTSPPNPAPADGELVDGLANLVERWNATADAG
ncbi:MAG: hypothetical protein ABWX74_09400 [Aeromicrobium sp.]